MNNLPKLTPAQTWLVHTLETLCMGAIVDGSINVYQSVATGNYDWKSLLGIFGTAFIAVLAKGSANSIKNSANLLPAIHDTVAEIPGLRDAIDQLITRQIITSNAQANTQQSPLVVVHATQPTVQPAVQGSPVQEEPPTGPQPTLRSPIPQRPKPGAPVLATVPVPQADAMPVAQQIDLTRHFGDSGLIPAVQSGQ